MCESQRKIILVPGGVKRGFLLGNFAALCACSQLFTSFAWAKVGRP